MKESSGQLPPGLFGAANIHADGLFDECLAIRAPAGFSGQYCSIYFKPVPVNTSEIIFPSESPDDAESNERSNFITIFQLLGLISGPQRVEPKVETAESSTSGYPSVSLCLPSSCSADDVGQAVAQLIGGYVIRNATIVTVTDEQYCFTDKDDSPSFDGADIAVM